LKKFILKIPVIILFCAFSFSGQKDIFKEADLLLDMMEYEAAIVNYLKVLSQDPQQGDVRKKIGYAYFQLGKTDDAVKFLKEELTLFPDNGDAYDLIVYVLLKTDRIQENYNFLESLDLQAQSEKENSNSGLGDFILGMHFKEAENTDKAAKFFRKALERGHDSIKCYVQLLDSYLIKIDKSVERPLTDLPREGLGIVILNEARNIFGGTPSEIHFLLGLRYFANSKTNVQFVHKSVESFEIAASLQPDNDLKDALFNLACISYNRNDFEKASEYFRRVLGIEPENDETKFYLDCCCKKLDKSADKEFISQKCPKQIDLSRDFIDQPDREYKQKFINDSSFVLQNINNLAIELIQKDRFQEALEKFCNGLKIYPDSPVLNLNTAIVYSWLDNLEEAEKHALISLRKEDFGRIPKSRKREILRRKKASSQTSTKIPLSEWAFWVALEEGNYFSDAYNHLGTIYFKKRELNKAISAFKKTIEINPLDARGHFNLGCSYRAVGNRGKAEEEWRKAIQYEKEFKKEKESGHVSEDQLDITLIVLETRVAFKAHIWEDCILRRVWPIKHLKSFRKP